MMKETELKLDAAYTITEKLEKLIISEDLFSNNKQRSKEQ